ncbi:Ribonuclease H-like domain,HAT, C-terminal dimerisation domain [Cinara cedri]|uniref:Ribonuclease H-like domain,HAT, C-terminal dimerisation domain n=1 Tax=Cinara cedri TaxID=506608 RepID=A0A5E4N5Q6_9HEMI|nr:Ribonuclease H-like domain,HAT, C-terminal dimerisation domain [Cinara cedri]
MKYTISTWINESNEDLEIEEVQSKFEVKRISRKKKMASYEATGDTIMNVEKKFTVDAYNRVFDTIIQSMENRFTNDKEILLDLTLLSPVHIDSFVNRLPKNAFAKSAVNLKPYFDEDNKNEIKYKLCEEILSFSKSWKNLKKSVDDEYIGELYINSDTENEDEDRDISKLCKTCKNCSICCYNVLIKYNLYSNAYPPLAIAHQYLQTLPVTRVACERSFSTLKRVNNRLRSSMTTEHLESFVLAAIAKQILRSLDNDMIVNKACDKSKLFSKLLL